MKALVTGGAGFIGSQLISHLLTAGLEIVVIDKRKTTLTNSPHVHQYNRDIRDPELEQIFKMEKPDVIYHLAAQISVAESMTDPFVDASANIMGTIHLLELAVKHQVEKVIFASSAAVYGIPNQLPIIEDHPIQPTSFYGLSKAVAEEYIAMYGRNHQLDYTILRFANVYGPGQTSNSEAGVITLFLQRLYAGLPLHIYGDGSQTRDFIHVNDVASACVKALQSASKRSINISSNTALSINQLLQLLVQYSEKHLVTNYTKRKPGDIMHSRLHHALASQCLSWHPTTSIEEGLRTYIEQVENYV